MGGVIAIFVIDMVFMVISLSVVIGTGGSTAASVIFLFLYLAMAIGSIVGVVHCARNIRNRNIRGRMITGTVFYAIDIAIGVVMVFYLLFLRALFAGYSSSGTYPYYYY